MSYFTPPLKQGTDFLSSSNPLPVSLAAGVASVGTVTLAAGEAHVGQIGGTVAVLTPTVTVDAALYATGDNMGGKLTLTGMTRIAAGSGMVQSVVITSKTLATFTADVIFFNADPSTSTFTTNVAQALHDDDLPKIIGVAQCNTVVALNSGAIAAS